MPEYSREGSRDGSSIPTNGLALRIALSGVFFGNGKTV